MLVLKRRCREQIRIGDNVILTVVGTNKNSVRLAFEAPGTVPIVREELLDSDDDEADEGRDDPRE